MTATQNPCLCAAWMGYAYDDQNADVMVRICAWCPDKRAAEREAARLSLEVTHGICFRCVAVQMDLI